MSDALSMIAELMSDEDGEEAKATNRPLEAQAKDLTDRFRAMQPKHQFQPGDLVQWREGLKNCKRPAYGHPAVVVGLLPDGMAQRSSESGYGYYGERADLQIGLTDADGDFMVYGACSQRMEPYSGPRLPDDHKH